MNKLLLKDLKIFLNNKYLQLNYGDVIYSSYKGLCVLHISYNEMFTEVVEFLKTLDYVSCFNSSSRFSYENLIYIYDNELKESIETINYKEENLETNIRYNFGNLETKYSNDFIEDTYKVKLLNYYKEQWFNMNCHIKNNHCIFRTHLITTGSNISGNRKLEEKTEFSFPDKEWLVDLKAEALKEKQKQENLLKKEENEIKIKVSNDILTMLRNNDFLEKDFNLENFVTNNAKDISIILESLKTMKF